jgi:hypothetical protein
MSWLYVLEYEEEEEKKDEREKKKKKREFRKPLDLEQSRLLLRPHSSADDVDAWARY